MDIRKTAIVTENLSVSTPTIQFVLNADISHRHLGAIQLIKTGSHKSTISLSRACEEHFYFFINIA